MGGEVERRRAAVPRPLDRREFLRRGALTGLGLGMLPMARAAGGADESPVVRRRVRLGRTGLEIPDIGFGASRLAGDTDLVRYALDRGITYFDTAEGYTGGRSEETIGRALEGRRDEVLIASKVIVSPDDSRERLAGALEGSLRRLRTDHIDVYFNHAVNDVARLRNPEWPEFVSRAREQGKIRFVGMSGHGGRLVECLDHALDEDLVDVILAAHNFGQDERFWEQYTRRLDFVARQPDLPRVLAKAKQKDVGVVAMKTLMGAKLNDLRPFETKGGTFAQAAMRWTLSQPHTDALVVTMKTRESVDEYLGASGWTRPRQADLGLLSAYLARNSQSQCRHGCSSCEGSCPLGVPVSEVLRTRMYAEDYGDPAQGREEYSGLQVNASACLSCQVRSCAAACPYGLDVAALTGRTHRLLGG